MPKNYPPAVLTVSKIISNFFNPLTSLIIYFVYSSAEEYSARAAFERFVPILLLTVLPIVIWLVWNVRTGKYSNMDVSNRQQRKSLYFFIAGSMVVYLLYDYLKNGTLDLIMLFLLVLLLVMQLSNYYIKSSMHTAFNVFVAALFFYRDTTWGIAWLLIATLVGITRIILKRHTVKEVFMGGSIALFVSFIYLYSAIQTQH
ncbi:ABC transporter permease [Chryseobacterium sp. 6424]|uniref:phosphatase PAP2 family protein n=1 Tax=Chryseobacterium sp. 6424 TaxID=2039166 RepID=UPI000EFD38F4|nr:phosphatase PAP2 family protein [Chryseobacterium sp. 6424]AYO57574.1 ABC transporter permease [Chryseobacterium sp. 6424]